MVVVKQIPPAGLVDLKGKRVEARWHSEEVGVPIQYWVAYYNDTSAVSSQMQQIGEVRLNNSSAVVVIDLLPHGYDASITGLAVWRRTVWGTSVRWRLAGFVRVDNHSVFVDNGSFIDEVITTLGDRRFPWEPRYLLYESGLRWSEPFQPNWIREESFTEIKAGDGEQITGLASIYGNLIVFKENSIIRVAILKEGDNPISRVDEITTDVGCIAPNTLVNVKNTLFFLSWSGFMMYDNNVVRNIDQKVHPEIVWLLQNASVEEIRLSSAVYDPINDELILVIPTNKRPPRWYDRIERIITNPWEEMWGDAPVALQEAHLYNLSGNVFVFKLNTGFVSKYLYTPYEWMDEYYPWSHVDGRIPRRWARIGDKAAGRVWCVDKLGMVYGGEIAWRNFPLYWTEGRPSPPYQWCPPPAVYVHNYSDLGYDEYIHYVDAPVVGSLGWLLASSPPFLRTFPVISRQLIYSYARTKEFVGDDKTGSKRVRMFNWSYYQPIVRMPTQPYAAVVEWSYRRGDGANHQGILYSGTPDVRIEVGAQFWLIGQSRKIGTIPGPTDVMNQEGIGWAMGVWVPPNYGMDGSSSVASLVPMTSSDEMTKPYRWSGVIETLGRAVVNGATIWWRPFANYLR